MGLNLGLLISGKHRDNEINCPAIIIIIAADLVTVLWILLLLILCSGRRRC